MSTPERTGPGQSGAAAGQSYFDDSRPGEMAYPTESLPQGSRSTFDVPPLWRPELGDNELRARIVEALHDVAPRVEVSVARGTVTLAGHVDGDDARRCVADLVREVPGVDVIDDHMEVRS
ncbi:MAG TPA: BON domain-containing protein [Kofleriaceae bacterium]|jgi:hypothetical protein